jgi:hypothetical protein
VGEVAARGEAVEWKTRAHDRPEDLTDRLLAAGFLPEPRETVLIGLAGQLSGVAPVALADVQAAVSKELRDYWHPVASHRMCWLQDSWVDLGLTVLPRISAVLSSGDLIAKTEAIVRLADFGVPAGLAGEIRRRRDGQVVRLGAVRKVRRALVVRRLMRRGVRQLSRIGPQVGGG